MLKQLHMDRRQKTALILSLALFLSCAGLLHADTEEGDALAQKALSLVSDGKFDEAARLTADLERIDGQNSHLPVLRELLAARQSAAIIAAAGAEAAPALSPNDQICLWASEGKLGSVRDALDKGASPNLIDQFGTTILEHAVQSGSTEIVQLLVDRGADVNVQNSRGTTPLMTAVWNGNTEIVKILLEKGADPNIRNGSGTSATMLAKWKKRDEIIPLLLEKGAVE
ncbi:MAG: ankyrin repeat domain-containing protein [Candidatus Omnitrophica bacterium]|nr:ankyrin repeat domain-containing protein [Candidatus Omnitrophota bacterium]